MRTILSLVAILVSLASGHVSAAPNTLVTELRELKGTELKRYHVLKKNLETASDISVSALSQLWQEQRLRIDVLDRLIFYTDSHFKKGDPRAFLQEACLKVAARDIEDAPGKGKEIWPFLRNFSYVLNETKDSDLSGPALLASFFEHSSVTSPKDVKSFLRARDYTNGQAFEEARSMSREDLASLRLEKMAAPLSAPKLKPVSLLDSEDSATASESFQ